MQELVYFAIQQKLTQHCKVTILQQKLIFKKDTCTHILIAALFTIPKTGKYPKCPSTDEWVKMWYNTYSEILLSHKKNEIMPCAATRMEFEIVTLSEVRKRKTNII